ncbi:hypothetical protein BDY24DRAFT_383812 [Mrakia frigida]|uniref:uncharacterized protein n=1 Tax=Mrakia frigida TaxID=29902 RepID=UPI003FCC1078
MTLSSLPPLAGHLSQLSQRPSLPQSLNLLHLLLVPFLPPPSSSSSSSSSPTVPPPTWETILNHYGPNTSIHHLTLPSDSSAWATLLLRPPPPPSSNGVPGRTFSKLSLAFSDPSPTSESREPLFKEMMDLVNELLPKGSEIYFCGLPDSLIGVFEEEVKGEVKGKFRSYKVQLSLEEAVEGKKSGGGKVKVLEEGRFERSVLREEEVQKVLTLAQRPNPPSDFTPTLHLSSCIRDLETPGQEPISWALVYDDLSVAALHTLPTYRSLSLASHTVQNLAVHLQDAFDQLPEEFGLKGTGWIAADWDDGNPAGKGFFAREGWELLEEGVRWAKGVL